MDVARWGAGLLGLAVLVGASAPSQAAVAAAAARPSIVVFLSDDEDLASHAYMSKTKRLIEDQGVNLANYFVSYSFCCPSRTTILRGQYAHNHRIEGNDLPTGGFAKFKAMGHGRSTVATWLDAAGYHTGFFGKLMNGYEAEQDAPLPGWDDWYGVGGGFRNFDYTLNENGKLVAYGSRPEDHLTDVLARKAVQVIRETAADEPLFLYIAPYDPHAPSTPAPRHADKFKDLPFPKTPSYDEADVGDKHGYIKNLPPLEDWEKEAHVRHHRERLRSLLAVDDMVESVMGALAETGRLANTYVIYTSDNGFHLGQHRLFFGKTTAYEEDIRVPFVMRGPGVPKGERIQAMVLNNDLAPTFAAIAGVTPPSFVDGRSFLPLLEDPGQPWRKSFLVGRRQMETHEISGPAIFDAIRTPNYTYIEFGTGERELYDLRRDPHQLASQVDTADPTLVAALSARLAELKNCAADYCRELEDLPVEPSETPVADSEAGGAG